MFAENRGRTTIFVSECVLLKVSLKLRGKCAWKYRSVKSQGKSNTPRTGLVPRHDCSKNVRNHINATCGQAISAMPVFVVSKRHNHGPPCANSWRAVLQNVAGTRVNSNIHATCESLCLGPGHTTNQRCSSSWDEWWVLHLC